MHLTSCVAAAGLRSQVSGIRYQPACVCAKRASPPPFPRNAPSSFIHTLVPWNAHEGFSGGYFVFLLMEWRPFNSFNVIFLSVDLFRRDCWQRKTEKKMTIICLAFVSPNCCRDYDHLLQYLMNKTPFPGDHLFLRYTARQTFSPGSFESFAETARAQNNSNRLCFQD